MQFTKSTCIQFVVGLLLIHEVRAQEPVPYGLPITLEMAKKVMLAAEQEARKQKWPVAICIVDGSGFLVMFQRLENTQLGSVEVSMEKAKTAALYRRPTKVFEDRLVSGGADLKVLRLPGLPIEGGIPLVHEGKIIGAIGVSGVQSSQDALIAAAGVKALP